MLCEKCKKEFGERMNLAGGTHARLCTVCSTLWDEYVKSHTDLWRRYSIHEACKILWCATGTTNTSAEGLAVEKLEIESELHELAKEWLGDRATDSSGNRQAILEKALECILEMARDEIAGSVSQSSLIWEIEAAAKAALDKGNEP